MVNSYDSIEDTSAADNCISSRWPKCGFGRRTRPRNTRNTPERFTTKYRSTPERFAKKYRTIPERFAKKYIAMRVEVLKDTFQGEGRGSGSAPRLSAARRGSTAQARRGSTAQRGARRARRGEGVSRPPRAGTTSAPVRVCLVACRVCLWRVACRVACVHTLSKCPLSTSRTQRV